MLFRSFSTKALRQLIQAGNQAAHGAEVEKEVTNWAFVHGRKILIALDAQLAKDQVPDLDEWLSRSMIILDFHGEDVVSDCTDLLSLAKRDAQIRLRLSYINRTSKAIAAELLTKLGALEPATGEEGMTRSDNFRITAAGNALLSRLLLSRD